MRCRIGAVMLMGAVALAGCSSKGLRDLQPSGPGPDEFMIMPVKPLTAPKDYDVLPAPTPGGSNLVDTNPNAEAVAALGGRPSALDPNAGIPASDGALVNASSRYGVESNIRTSLAEADAQFRKRQSRMTRLRLFRVDRYDQAYRKEALDPFDTTGIYRESNFGTPASPPDGE